MLRIIINQYLSKSKNIFRIVLFTWLNIWFSVYEKKKKTKNCLFPFYSTLNAAPILSFFLKFCWHKAVGRAAFGEVCGEPVQKNLANLSWGGLLEGYGEWGSLNGSRKTGLETAWTRGSGTRDGLTLDTAVRDSPKPEWTKSSMFCLLSYSSFPSQGGCVCLARWGPCPRLSEGMVGLRASPSRLKAVG